MADIYGMLAKRDETALAILKEEYEAYCGMIIRNLLGDEERVEEVLNDLWIMVWRSVPPARPLNWKAWLARCARNLAIDRIRHDEAAGRSAVTVLLDELSECLPDPRQEHLTESSALRDALHGFLESVGPEERQMFLRRYWFGETAERIARELGTTQSRVNGILYRMRKRLRRHLEQEGYTV